MDDPKTPAGLPASKVGAPPANLPVASDTSKPVVPVAPSAKSPVSTPSPSTIPSSTVTPKSSPVIPAPSMAQKPVQSSPPTPAASVPDHGTEAQHQGNIGTGPITLPRSSIRTMESDIKSSQLGQAPKNIEIKSSTIPAEKPATLPAGPVKPASPLPVPQTGVKLGEAEKRTTPFPGQSIPKLEQKLPEKLLPPVVVAPPIPTPVLKAPLVLPPKPVVPPVGGVSVPPMSSLFANKKVLIGAAAVVILILTGAFLYLQNDQETEVAQTTITPNASLSPSAEISSFPASTTLTSLFTQFFHLAVSADDPDALVNFNSEAVGVSNKSSAQKNTLVFVKEGSGDFYKFSNFLNRFSVSYPANLSSSLDNNDFGIILTKVTEFFDQNGKVVASPSAEMLLKPQMALVVRVVDATEAKQQLSFWEDTMIENLKDFYDLPAQFGDPHFAENIYQGIKIRYVNFPYPDKAIDYAIVTAKNGNDYLVIANSREQMFSNINKFLGF